MRRYTIGLCLLLSACTSQAGDDAELDAELNDPSAPSYPEHALQSPLTPEVVQNLKAIYADGQAAGLRRGVFSKIGDSITFSTSFATCLAAHAVRVDAELAASDDNAVQADLEATRQLFGTARVGSTDSYRRVSLSATIGWMAVKAIQGSPNSALDRELDASHASIAVIMYGTNDTYAGTETQFRRNLTRIVDRAIARGVVPILSTIPPRRDATPNALVPTMNGIIRTIAEQKRIPLMNLWEPMSRLPGYGLSGDGIHPQVSGDGCDFSHAGLLEGYNWRNLLLIEALDRVQRALDDTTPNPLPAPSPEPVVDPTPDPTMPAVDPTASCFSYTLQVSIPGAECVQSVTDSRWYQCVPMMGWYELGGDGTGPLGPCTVEHPL